MRVCAGRNPGLGCCSSATPSMTTHDSIQFVPDRLKDVAQEQYTQAEAEFAAGMTKEILPPAHGGGAGVSMMVN